MNIRKDMTRNEFKPIQIDLYNNGKILYSGRFDKSKISRVTVPQVRYYRGIWKGERIGIQPMTKTAVFRFIDTPPEPLEKIIVVPWRMLWRKPKKQTEALVKSEKKRLKR